MERAESSNSKQPRYLRMNPSSQKPSCGWALRYCSTAASLDCLLRVCSEHPPTNNLTRLFTSVTLLPNPGCTQAGRRGFVYNHPPCEDLVLFSLILLCSSASSASATAAALKR